MVKLVRKLLSLVSGYGIGSNCTKVFHRVSREVVDISLDLRELGSTSMKEIRANDTDCIRRNARLYFPPGRMEKRVAPRKMVASQLHWRGTFAF